MELLSIKKDTNGKNKYVATFKNKETGRTKTTHFGAVGYEDFTIHKDEERKKKYIARHKSREDWNDYTSKGSLAYYILWNKPTIRESIADYKKKFNL